MIGRTCDECRPDYYNFTSGQGCTGDTTVIKRVSVLKMRGTTFVHDNCAIPSGFV